MLRTQYTGFAPDTQTPDTDHIDRRVSEGLSHGSQVWRINKGLEARSRPSLPTTKNLAAEHGI